jgi:SAM-dependent methyltransferase
LLSGAPALPKMQNMQNADPETIEGFGREWTRFDQSELDERELRDIVDQYFSIFPWSELPPDAVGFDLGCGSGRWARSVAGRVGTLHCIDASEAALTVARKNLATTKNCVFHLASVDAIPLPEASCDFGYSLGVLHHVPDTAAGIRSCAAKLKPGAPLLLYLYYAFDNRPAWFRRLWRASNAGRLVISRLPFPLRLALSQAIAASVYFPLARAAGTLEKLGIPVDSFPLSFYRGRSFYAMRTDALDRFGTRLEQRFTKQQVRRMMTEAGLVDLIFREAAPYWCVVGRRDAAANAGSPAAPAI